MSSSPSNELFELLPLHAMGALGPADAATVEQALLERWRDAFAAMGLSELPVPPDPRTRVRLLASAGAPAAAIGRFAAEVAELFDLPIDDARAALKRADDAAAWKPLIPGIERLPIAAGPRFAGTDCSLVRLAPGVRFPWHRHLGEEVSLVLHGGAHISDGRDLGPGDVMVVNEDVEHDFVIAEGGDVCIVALRMVGIVPVSRAR
jgi:putative transcriptional regulator